MECGTENSNQITATEQGAFKAGADVATAEPHQ